MNTISADIKQKLAESKEYREEFVAALVKRAFPRQIKTIRKARGLSQEELAIAANVDQGVISRAENPSYGNLTFNTALRVSAGFDLAFIPKLVTFNEFLEWVEEVTEGFTNLPSFEKEREIEALAAIPSHQKKAPARALHLVWENPSPPTQGLPPDQRTESNELSNAGVNAAMGGQYEASQRSAG